MGRIPLTTPDPASPCRADHSSLRRRHAPLRPRRSFPAARPLAQPVPLGGTGRLRMHTGERAASARRAGGDHPHDRHAANPTRAPTIGNPTQPLTTMTDPTRALTATAVSATCRPRGSREPPSCPAAHRLPAVGRTASPVGRSPLTASRDANRLTGGKAATHRLPWWGRSPARRVGKSSLTASHAGSTHRLPAAWRENRPGGHGKAAQTSMAKDQGALGGADSERSSWRARRWNTRRGRP